MRLLRSLERATDRLAAASGSDSRRQRPVGPLSHLTRDLRGWEVPLGQLDSLLDCQLV
jgi:hypothetical protein